MHHTHENNVTLHGNMGWRTALHRCQTYRVADPCAMSLISHQTSRGETNSTCYSASVGVYLAMPGLRSVATCKNVGPAWPSVTASAVTHNGIVATGEFLSGGNFHADPVAVAADQIALAISAIGAVRCSIMPIENSTPRRIMPSCARSPVRPSPKPVRPAAAPDSPRSRQARAGSIPRHSRSFRRC